MRCIVTIAASRENPHVVLCMTYDHGHGRKSERHQHGGDRYIISHLKHARTNIHRHKHTQTTCATCGVMCVCVFLRAVACGVTWRVQLVDSPIEPSHTGRHLAEVKKNTCERHVLGCVIHKHTVFPVKIMVMMKTMMMISMRLTVHDIHVCMHVCLCCLSCKHSNVVKWAYLFFCEQIIQLERNNNHILMIRGAICSEVFTPNQF